MSVIETIEAIRNGLMWICLSALAAIVVGVVGAWLYRGVASAMRRLLAVVRLAAFVAVSAFCVIRGGAKFLMPPSSTGGTPVVPVVVTPEEIAQGYRLESVATNNTVSYAMPTNGVEYAPWSQRGGYETHFPLDLGDFTERLVSVVNTVLDVDFPKVIDVSAATVRKTKKLLMLLAANCPQTVTANCVKNQLDEYCVMTSEIFVIDKMRKLSKILFIIFAGKRH